MSLPEEIRQAFSDMNDVVKVARKIGMERIPISVDVLEEFLLNLEHFTERMLKESPPRE